MPGTTLEGQIPVFVYPTNLTFSLQDECSHKQVLTIYNPYDFPLSYLLLSTAPEKYYIPDSSGDLKARNRVDILVRHSYPTLRNVGIIDKLRVQITEKGKKKVLGKKDIPVQLIPDVPERELHRDRDNFEAIPHRQRYGSSTPPPQQDFTSIRGAGNNENWFCVQVVSIVLCLIALMLPTEGDQSQSIIPPVLHFSTGFKNVASFVLGLVVCAVLNRQG